MRRVLTTVVPRLGFDVEIDNVNCSTNALWPFGSMNVERRSSRQWTTP
jgi:hypothetical protein